MFNNRKKISKLLPIGILLLISLVAYRTWLSFSIFLYGDGIFFFKEALREFIIPSSWGWIGGPLLWHYPFNLLYGIFGYLGFGTNVAEKFIIFWPIIFLTPIAGFLFVRKITNSGIAAFIGSLVFSFNTYFLSIETQSHHLLIVAFIFGLFSFLSFIYLLENKKKILIPVTTLLLFVTGFYDLRSLYVVAGTIFLYLLYNQFFIEMDWKKSLRNNFLQFLTVFFLLFLLNLFWLIPTIAIGALTNNEYLSRAIFGSQFYDLQSSLAFFYPYWTGKEPTWLYVQKIPLHFWLYPLLAFSGFIVARKNKAVLFFGALALIGIFLAKQEAPPLGFIYTFLFNHLPGFSAFREASKFDFLIIISFAVLIGIFAQCLIDNLKNKKIAYLSIFLVALLPLWNIKPLLTGEIKTMFVPLSVHSDFTKLKDHILSDPAYSRVIGVSHNTKYIFATYTHPQHDLRNSLEHFWGTDITGYDIYDKSLSEGEKLMAFLKTDKARRLLSASSVGFVPVFVKDDPTYQSLRRDTGKDRGYIEGEMDKIPYLVKADLGMENIILYSMSDYKHHLYLTSEPEALEKDVLYTNVDFKMVSPSEYRFTVRSLDKPMYLNFTELYSPAWKIRVGDFKWWNTIYKKDYFLSDSIHSENPLRFNQFYIDPKEVCSSTPCNFEATLYARPQSYLYLGLILSGMALVITIDSIFHIRRHEKRRKK